MADDPTPIIIRAPNALDVAPQHQNKIIVAQVFTVTPGTTSKRDESRQRVLKEFPYSVVSEERRAYLEGEMSKIYHHMPLRYYDLKKTDYECLIAFHERNLGTAWTELPLDQ